MSKGELTSFFPQLKQVGNERGTANLEQQKEHLFT